MSTSLLRRHSLRIFRAALAAADPAQAVRRHVHLEGGVLTAARRRYSLDRFQNIYVIGAGKASASMARAIERILGKRIRAGAINVKYGDASKFSRIEVHEAGHPIPDHNGLTGAKRIAEIAREVGRDDLIVCLISGGASALAPLPVPPVTLRDKQSVTKLLLECGATIHEINPIRKHLSALKGGQLARLAHPATLLTLILSDVIGDNLDVIGSGPTVPDNSTFADAAAILRRYGIFDKAPATVRSRLEQGIVGRIPETPKPGDPIFRETQNIIVGSNRLAVEAAARQARALGYHPLILSSQIEGEAREVAKVHAAIAKEILATGHPVNPPACVISGGETTVTLHGKGLGGRNQEFALAAALEIAGLPGVGIFSAGTDGTDGPTAAAGAFAAGDSIARSHKLGLDARRCLDNNDSYHFFDPLDDLIRTGPTGTNVMDIRLLLVVRLA